MKVESGLGRLGGLSFVYALTPNVAFDATLRIAWIDYTLFDPTGAWVQVGAGHGAFTLGAYYNF